LKKGASKIISHHDPFKKSVVKMIGGVH